MYQEKEVNFFIDGASRGNPGPAGIGIIIYDNTGKCIRKIYKYIGKVTNNIAEYTALNFALQEALISNFRNISIKTDSQLLARQLKGDYKVKSDNIKPLYLLAKNLIETIDKVEIIHINRTQNKDADKLASLAVKER